MQKKMVQSCYSRHLRKYSDGTTEEVYAFDVPVEALDQEFDLAILGTKGTWYDHKVSVSDAQKAE